MLSIAATAVQVIAEVLAVQYALAALLVQVQALLRANQFLAKYRWEGGGVGRGGAAVTGWERAAALLNFQQSHHSRFISFAPNLCRQHSLFPYLLLPGT